MFHQAIYKNKEDQLLGNIKKIFVNTEPSYKVEGV
jgi:hypothetical protein